MIRLVEHGSSEYWDTVALRDRVLRKPLGLEFTQQELLAEDGQWHLALFAGDQVMACLVLVPLDGGEVKMRQVAVDPDAQGQGLGRRLVEGSERLSRERGFGLMTLHARETAIPFYERLGYAVVGEPFTEVGIPHRKMKKEL